MTQKFTEESSQNNFDLVIFQKLNKSIFKEESTLIKI